MTERACPVCDGSGSDPQESERAGQPVACFRCGGSGGGSMIVCDACGGSMEVTDTNGASYPEPLVETRECQSCGYETTKVLTA